VSATVPLSYFEEPRLRGYSFAGLLLGTAIVFGWGFAYLFARLMTRPLDEPTRTAALVGHGEQVQASHMALMEANVLLETLVAASRELASRQEHARILMQELAHRAKNQLAVIKGMALQTSRQSESVGDFMVRFDQRVQGLARSQDVLLQQNWRGARLDDLVHAHLDLFGVDDRVSVHGQRIFLDAAAVQNVGFALHELATNALKHGSLSWPSGRVTVSWIVNEEAVQLAWTEEEGPTAAADIKEGFGHRVVTELVPRALNGSASLEFSTLGVVWQLSIPANHVLPEDQHQH
jgi:two-component sensor histidine kinase